MSACCAAMRSSTFSPAPPIRIGVRRTGLGSQHASDTWKCRPAKVTRSSLHSRRRMIAVSSSARMRSPSGGNALPVPVNSASNQPAPRPAIARPPEIWSSVAICLARIAGLRKNGGVTSVPSSTRS